MANKGKYDPNVSTAPAFPPPDSWNTYLSWVVMAILGRLADADAIMSSHKAKVFAVARYMQHLAPPPRKTLYRGVLLAPDEAHGGMIAPDDRYKSVSFTEDKAVACWFANIGSSISGFVIEIRPNVEGYVIHHTPATEDILFHHSWDSLGAWPHPLATLARMHPQIGPMADQVAWALKTQSEVIVKAITKPLRIERQKDAGCAGTKTLDAKLDYKGG